MSLLWRTAAQKHPLYYAQKWADEYAMSPVAHPDVVDIIRTIPPVEHAQGSAADLHETYSKLMGNVVHHHAQEWFKAGDDDEFHEPTHHMTQHYLDAHSGTHENPDLL